jgi:tight adherence protein C
MLAPALVRIIISVVCLTSGLFLLRRYLKKRRQGKAEGSPEIRPAKARAKPASADAPAKPKSAPPPVPQTAARTAESAPAPVASAAKVVPVTSADAAFSTFGVKKGSDRLPRVEPADVPTASTDDYVYGAVTPLLASLLPESQARREVLKKELQNAGYYQPHALLNLSAIRYVLIVVPMLAMGALMVAVPQNLEPFALGGMLGFSLLGWSLPRLYLRSKATDRRSEIERSLPDMLDMLNMCISQGMTLLAAMKRVNQELGKVYPTLSQELQIVAEQAEIGTLEHALENLHQRVDVPDVHSFTMLLIQTERMGTSISIALAEYAERMRENLRQRADEKANQATFKLLFPTVLCLMPAVYIFLLGPSIVELSDFFGGGNSVLSNSTDAVQRFNQR